MKFRKNPIVIESVQFTGANSSEILHFIASPNWDHPDFNSTDRPIIHTLEGPLTVSNGDWVIKGVNGEFNSCKPDIFETTYEPAE